MYFNGIKTQEELRREYRRLAMEHHPDRGGNTRIMQEINREYAALSRSFAVFSHSATAQNRTESREQSTTTARKPWRYHCPGYKARASRPFQGNLFN